MQSVYRIISRDYKHSYNYFTAREDVFRLFADSDGLDTPELPQEIADKYGVDINDGAWELLDDVETPTFPYVLLGETTQYMT